MTHIFWLTPLIRKCEVLLYLHEIQADPGALTLCLFLQKSIAMPDIHSGYGFAIGNVAAFDMDDPEAVVSPGGVGFDINCGVRLLRTNLVWLLYTPPPPPPLPLSHNLSS
jgi:hypothetical protein